MQGFNSAPVVLLRRCFPFPCTQGVGRATALVFARKGYNVVVAARDPTKLQYVAQDCAAVAGRTGASLAGEWQLGERQVEQLRGEAGCMHWHTDKVDKGQTKSLKVLWQRTFVYPGKEMHEGPSLVARMVVREGDGHRPRVAVALTDVTDR